VRWSPQPLLRVDQLKLVPACSFYCAKPSWRSALVVLPSTPLPTLPPLRLSRAAVFQRRRWLNGSFFSLIYYVAKFHNLLSRSDHSLFRRVALMVQFFYQVSALILSWFGVGSLYLSLIVIFQLALETINIAHKDQLLWVFSMWYSYLVVIQVRTHGRVPGAREGVGLGVLGRG
jgi:cellulose synthase/poly-beta-1,6-N-acetylglucosamine synthase-like glycosyltransferase